MFLEYKPKVETVFGTDSHRWKLEEGILVHILNGYKPQYHLDYGRARQKLNSVNLSYMGNSS